jgi:hypothetical protein
MRCAPGTGREAAAEHPQPFYFGIILRIMEIRLKMILRGAHSKSGEKLFPWPAKRSLQPPDEKQPVCECVWRLFLMFAPHEEFISIRGGDPTKLFSG